MLIIYFNFVLSRETYLKLAAEDEEIKAQEKVEKGEDETHSVASVLVRTQSTSPTKRKSAK